MSNYKPWNPDWRYTKFTVDCLEQIQQEFEYVCKHVWHTFSDNDLTNSSPDYWDFSMMPREGIEEHVPSLVKWLDSKSILDKWTATAFSVVNRASNPMRIHVDSIATDERRVSLNMPFKNCANTWTCWYNCELDEVEVPPEITPEILPHLHSRMIYDPPLQQGRWGVEPCNEIDRAEMDQPVLVNVTVPHRPVSGHNNERILLCHRFTPELTQEEMDRICNR